MAALATTYMYMQFFSSHQIGNKQHQCNPLVKITVFKLHSRTLQATFKINIHYQKIYTTVRQKRRDRSEQLWDWRAHTCRLTFEHHNKKMFVYEKKVTFLNQQMYNHRCVSACGHDNGKERIHVHACTKLIRMHKHNYVLYFQLLWL